jgi:hypothetical protein
MNKTLAISLALALLLVAGTLPASAATKKVRHAGQIVGDDATRVTLKLTKRDGKIRKLSRFRATDVYARCDGRNARASFAALDPTRVTPKGNFKERLKNPNGETLRIKGSVKRRGKKVVGFISTNDFDGGSAGTCRVPKQKFVTRRT